MQRIISTETLARASARRPWLTIGVWVVLFLLSGLLSMTLLGDALTTNADLTTTPESKQARQLIEDRLRGPQRVNEIVIVQSEDAIVDDPAFRNLVEELYNDITALGPGVIANATNYYQSGDQALVSADRHITILPFAMAGGIEDAHDNVDHILNILDSAKTDGFEILVAGNASMGKDFQEAADKDLQTGEMFGIPIALIILVLVFGTVAASVIPIVLALLAIALAVGATALLGQGFDFSFFVVNMITMIGLAVGIDYSLFIISRYREERQRGLDKLEAIVKAGATASRTVFFSGVTVVIALLGMLIVPQTIFRSLALGAVLVAIMAVAASLTLLPAILSLLGDKINWGRIPLIQRAEQGSREERPGGFWDRVASVVMRYPVEPYA